MNPNELEKAYNSLVSCIIGTVSMADILKTREMLSLDPDPLWDDYYQRAIDEHCAMKMFNNSFIQ